MGSFFFLQQFLFDVFFFRLAISCLYFSVKFPPADDSRLECGERVKEREREVSEPSWGTRKDWVRGQAEGYVGLGAERQRLSTYSQNAFPGTPPMLSLQVIYRPLNPMVLPAGGLNDRLDG